jgi:hypothetical protein
MELVVIGRGGLFVLESLERRSLNCIRSKELSHSYIISITLMSIKNTHKSGGSAYGYLASDRQESFGEPCLNPATIFRLYQTVKKYLTIIIHKRNIRIS